MEHSTIPLYLTALFSMGNGTDEAAGVIHSVVVEEMLHMTTACNCLNAIGGAPMIDSPSFIPSFPMRLPLTNVSVGIAPFSRSLMQKFMLVESTTAAAKSIGAAYTCTSSSNLQLAACNL